MRYLTHSPRYLLPAVLIVAALAVALGLRLTDLNLATAQTPTLVSLHAPSDPGLDPAASVWNDVDSIEVPLTAQELVYPTGGGTVPTISIQSVHYDSTLFVRVEWEDASPDQLTIATEDFADAIALEFPAQSASTVPSVCMGQADAGVNIWHWRADSQRGLMVLPAEAYPGLAVDWYPFEGEELFYPARAAGNPYATPDSGAVQNLTAQMFGSLTPTGLQNVAGQGAHENGRWFVVLARPFDGGGPEQATFSEGTVTDMAVAVWDGSRGDRNGQKSVSQFMRLDVSDRLVGAVTPTADEAAPTPDEEAPAPAAITVEEEGRDWALIIGLGVVLPLAMVLLVAGGLASRWRARQS